jgi:hypothetical protein
VTPFLMPARKKSRSSDMPNWIPFGHRFEIGPRSEIGHHLYDCGRIVVYEVPPKCLAARSYSHY